MPQKSMNCHNKTTVGENLAKQNPEAFALLQNILIRPEIYFGTKRFNYLEPFFSGYTYKSKREFHYVPDAEVQYWLLHTQSASLHAGAMQGRDLFCRLFGSREFAFEQYNNFLAACIPEELNQVTSELCFYEDEHNTVRYDWEDDVPQNHHEQLAKTVVSEIKNMINQEGLPFDELRIYVRKEGLFVQVRFMFRIKDIWQNDTALIAKFQNHNVLLAIHASVRNTTTQALVDCGCEVNDTIEFSNTWDKNEIFDLGCLITNETTFLSEYLKWKESHYA